MQVYFNQNLASLAVPKTGSTAYELALRPYADIVFSKRRKHMTARQFHNKAAPFLLDLYRITPERIAVMRDPVEQLRSWYRYRKRERLDGTPNSTTKISFDEFVLAAISDAPPAFAATGSQFRFLSLADGSVPVHHLFAYENQPLFRAFLEERFEAPLEFKLKNVSPDADASLSDDIEKKLRHSRADDFELHDRLMQAEGHLRPFSG